MHVYTCQRIDGRTTLQMIYSIGAKAYPECSMAIADETRIQPLRYPLGFRCQAPEVQGMVLLKYT